MQNVNSVIRRGVLIGAAVLATFGSISTAQAAKLSASDENKLIAVCEAIQNDNRVALRRAVKYVGLSYRQLADGLMCNGLDMYQFALMHNAKLTGAIIAKRTNLSDRVLTAQRTSLDEQSTTAEQ